MGPLLLSTWQRFIDRPTRTVRAADNQNEADILLQAFRAMDALCGISSHTLPGYWSEEYESLGRVEKLSDPQLS